MKASSLAFAFAVLSISPALCTDDDGGFHSISDYRAFDPSLLPWLRGLENIDDLFDTRGIAQRLTSEKRVRLVRIQGEDKAGIMRYEKLERKGPLQESFGKELHAVQIAEKDFRPVIDLAADFNNYGEGSGCSFEPGVALLIGGNEPEFILICCFICHDVHVVRRPTEDHPMPQVAHVEMSPELETAIFRLAQATFPDDEKLRTFSLEERLPRSKTPITKSFFRQEGGPFKNSPEKD